MLIMQRIPLKCACVRADLVPFFDIFYACTTIYHNFITVLLQLESFPFFPDFRAVADSRLLPVPDYRRFDKLQVFKELFFPVRLIGQISEYLRTRNRAVGHCVQPDRCFNAAEFPTAHADPEYVDTLEFYPAFLEITFRFFCIKAFRFPENLYIQIILANSAPRPISPKSQALRHYL